MNDSIITQAALEVVNKLANAILHLATAIEHFSPPVSTPSNGNTPSGGEHLPHYCLVHDSPTY